MSRLEDGATAPKELLDSILANQADAPEQAYSEAAGEFGHVLLGRTKVIKMPGDGAQAESMRSVLFESAIIAELDRAALPPPVSIPSVIEAQVSSPPYYMAITRVGEDVLDQSALRHFDPTQLRDYGTRIGSFVAWMEVSLSIDSYKGLYDASGRPQIFDRADFIRISPEHFANQSLPPDLRKLLFDVRDEFVEREKDGDLKPNLVGHDDLRVGNVAFSGNGVSRRLDGIFDFGLTKPSSPERELRALAPLPDALEAGIDTYETIARRKLSHELIGFWALAQVVTSYAGMLGVNNFTGAESKRIDLQTLLAGKNLHADLNP